MQRLVLSSRWQSMHPVARQTLILLIFGLLLAASFVGGHALRVFAQASCTRGEQAYLVVSGDTLNGIAARHHTTWRRLASYNHIRNANLIYPHQVICVPAQTGSMDVPTSNQLPHPNFGPKIEGYAIYVGQSHCDPTAKPGVIAFRDMFLKAFPGTRDNGITRQCNIGGRSEHKEGRAWDWAVSAADSNDVAKVNQAFAWLFATDKYGHQDAMIHRLGIMYIVWNHHIWSASIPSDGWLPYNGPNPHTDHVHFSFSWDGANMKTSLWHPSNSF